MAVGHVDIKTDEKTLQKDHLERLIVQILGSSDKDKIMSLVDELKDNFSWQYLSRYEEYHTGQIVRIKTNKILSSAEKKNRKRKLEEERNVSIVFYPNTTGLKRMGIISD